MNTPAPRAARSTPSTFRRLATAAVTVATLLAGGLVEATSASAAGPVDRRQSSVTRDPKGPVELGEDETVFVSVRDAAATPLPGLDVVLTADGGVTLGRGSAVTDATGRAALDATCTTLGDWTLSVRAGGVTLGEVGVTCIAPVPDPSSSRITATPNPTLPFTPVAVTVAVRNAHQSPIGGVPVTLTPQAGAGATITPSSGTVIATRAVWPASPCSCRRSGPRRSP